MRAMVRMRGRPRADAASSHVAGESECPHQAAMMDLCHGNRQGGGGPIMLHNAEAR